MSITNREGIPPLKPIEKAQTMPYLWEEKIQTL